MYAVIRTGGKQYRVTPEDVIQIEKIDAAEGDVLEFDDVLMVGRDGEAPQIGSPIVDGARVSAEVLEQGRGEKIIVFKKKRRKNYRRKNGHRQDLTTVRVLEVLGAGDKAKKSAGEGARAKKAPAKSSAKSSAKSGEDKSKTATAKNKSKAAEKSEAASDKKTAKKTETSGKTRKAGFQKLDKPSGEADDLKTLPGVGPKLAERLNGYGVFHFHQLAAMTEADVKEMDEALDLKGRAERDEWVKHAKQLAKG